MPHRTGVGATLVALIGRLKPPLPIVPRVSVAIQQEDSDVHFDYRGKRLNRRFPHEDDC